MTRLWLHSERVHVLNHGSLLSGKTESRESSRWLSRMRSSVFKTPAALRISPAPQTREIRRDVRRVWLDPVKLESSLLPPRVALCQPSVCHFHPFLDFLKGDSFRDKPCKS